MLCVRCGSATLQAISAQKEADPDDLPHHIGYLVQMGTQFFNDALDKMRQVLAGTDHPIDDVLDELRKGNDYICHSAALVSKLFARDGEAVQPEESAASNAGGGEDFSEEAGALA